MKNLFNRFVREEEGQDLVEYALLLALIAIVCIVAITTMGTTISGFMNQVSTRLGTVPVN
jgi:pilus assembly protein Flp/PilA